MLPISTLWIYGRGLVADSRSSMKLRLRNPLRRTTGRRVGDKMVVTFANVLWYVALALAMRRRADRHKKEKGFDETRDGETEGEEEEEGRAAVM
ncbi:hypothetical protein BV898_11598 [Hypsibius exemplaris]|uniref:Uncharacterized protein n=1 Tax=Hypsibius exemplaris TaxID=2072580 RepID=A0A1W0WGB2_HYPEX|nr:hypothetical protein BV898_11598 [Hypsibius exemplaris]